MESLPLSQCYYPHAQRVLNSVYEDRQIESERAQTYYISKNAKDYKTKILSIDNFGLSNDLKISNLSLRETKKLQTYRFRCSKTKYDKMCNSLKYIIDAYHFNYSTQDHNYSKTHFYCIAPALKPHNLPTVYRFSVCHDMDEPKHYSFNLYADCGGYADGFYFLARMDNDIPFNTHKVTEPLLKSEQKLVAAHPCVAEEICFPHIHKVKNFSYNYNPKEDVVPMGLAQLENVNQRQHLIYFMSLFHIKPQLFLMDVNTRVKDAISIFENQSVNNILQRYGADEFSKFIEYHESKKRLDGLPFQAELKAEVLQKR